MKRRDQRTKEAQGVRRMIVKDAEHERSVREVYDRRSADRHVTLARYTEGPLFHVRSRPIEKLVREVWCVFRLYSVRVIEYVLTGVLQEEGTKKLSTVVCYSNDCDAFAFLLKTAPGSSIKISISRFHVVTDILVTHVHV